MADVVVVDDSQFMRVQIREILEAGGHTVVAEAGNGKEAVDTVSANAPDVVTMDVKMPGMDGIEAVEKIMATQPTPVVMLSRYTEEGAETTLEALDAGAVDFMMKPNGEVTASLVQYADELVELVDVVAGADLDRSGVSSDRGRTFDTPTPEIPETNVSSEDWEIPPTVVIAASTGGPAELHTIFGALPGDLGARILIVQHMPEQFTDRFAGRLDAISAVSVREATPNDRVGPSEAILARGGCHLEVSRDTGRELSIELTEDPPVHSVKPAADVTFESVASTVRGPLVGIVLSGMGRDGAIGAEHVANAGGTVFVQSPDTASISSMPDNAIETGVVDYVHPTTDIPEALLTHLARLTPEES